MEAAALVAIVLSNGQGKPPDSEDFCGIILLLLINLSIRFYEEHTAGNALKALMDSLAPKAKVKRGPRLTRPSLPKLAILFPQIVVSRKLSMFQSTKLR